MKFLTGKGNTFSSFLQLHQLYKIVKSILQLLYSYAGARTQKQKVTQIYHLKKLGRAEDTKFVFTKNKSQATSQYA